eukprot:GHVT01094800.1.p1 GENE.GHVT01094800.1~~GHVT01094800.1.p1  ORF type:complete len:562 (-),score=143.19 GHVT01094800.1:574-2259(-)
MAQPAASPFWATAPHGRLQLLAEKQSKLHLRDALKDKSRNDKLFKAFKETLYLDYSREKVDAEVMAELLLLAKEMNVPGKIAGMFGGSALNATEGRAALHAALRARAGDKFQVDGRDVVAGVLDVHLKIQTFAEGIRNGTATGYTGKALKHVVCVGIGGSFLGGEFLAEALRTAPDGTAAAAGRSLRFLANVDPVDFARATRGILPEETLVVVVSKTFTTAETMLNARTMKRWLLKDLKEEKAIAKHMCAVSTNLTLTSAFGIDPANVFGFWEWVGGRYSVTSAVGLLPLALQYGWPVVAECLEGARAMDEHFKSAPLEDNLPVILALLSVWNSTYLKHSCVAVLPYAQALLRFAAHIQQLTMESNGKRVTLEGEALPVEAGEVFFGEPGTNGQHSFYQLLHQGRVVPAEFIGFRKSQTPIVHSDEEVSNHDELMCNFFAQPDALAIGKLPEELEAEGTPKHLIPHKTFSGDRPSAVLLMDEATPFALGVLLALYEHRTAVQGFVWGINSFDQFGVELGKVLAKDVRSVLVQRRLTPDTPTAGESRLCSSTQKLLQLYLGK